MTPAEIKKAADEELTRSMPRPKVLAELIAALADNAAKAK